MRKEPWLADGSAGARPEIRLAEMSAALTGRLRALTPARVGLKRSGTSLATAEVLDFQLAHARARDAVHARLEPRTLLPALRAVAPSEQRAEILLLHSAATDRLNYLQRPDLGRVLDDQSRQLLEPQKNGAFDLAIVLADGLSALAIERHAVPLLAELLPVLDAATPRLQLAPLCVVEQGRVAIGDGIALALGAAMVVVLIGERPGLSSADSMGAYITWLPMRAQAGGRITDAERNCISNIRIEGLSYQEAAARLLFYIHQGREKQLTGVTLKDPDAPVALGLQTPSLEEPNSVKSLHLRFRESGL